MSSSIGAAFHRCGVYPFDPDTIDRGINVDNPNSSDKDNDRDK